MTLVLAEQFGEYAVLAADRRVHVGPPNGPFVPDTADKLFLVGGCAVASFGSSPQGVDIPALIRSFGYKPWEPRALAQALYTHMASMPDPGAFGLLVLGVNGQQLELFEVELTNALLLDVVLANTEGINLQNILLSGPFAC
jgi:hypothetical protein